MKRLLEILGRYFHFFLFIILEVLALVMLVRYNFYHRTSYNYLANEIGGYVHSLTSEWQEYVYLKEVNLDLSVQNATLKNKLFEYKSKLDEVWEKVDQTDSTDFVFMKGKVVYNSVNTRHNYIILDVGIKDSIKPDMGVVAGNNVVGVVQSVTENYCRVLSLLNTDLRISAKIKKNNYYGSMYWDGNNPRQASLYDIPFHVELNKGDTIITSGYSSIFPEGLDIGTVSDFELKDGMFNKVNIDLFTDFKQLFHVEIVKNINKAEVKFLLDN